MWYIEFKNLINNDTQDNWVKQYSYSSDHYDLAKQDIEALRKQYSDRQFRLVCIDNF